ncbi:MAG: Fpg/Nei family DNA glycosylase [Spirochaetota bacterium]
MPELPDVEVFRRFLEKHAVGKTIRGVEVRDAKSVDGISGRKFESVVANRRVTKTDRHGKYLFAHLDDGHSIVFHFGMTGYLRSTGNEADGNDGKYCKVLFDLSDGTKILYANKRRLGMVTVVDDAASFIRKIELGTDALSLSVREFRKLLDGKRGSVKGFLMDQNTVAGIGNVYSDEILYQARIHPRRKVKDLSDEDISTLYNVMQDVLTTAVDNDADPERMAGSFLLKHRDEGDSCPRCGGSVSRISASGRSSYLCRRCQR